MRSAAIQPADAYHHAQLGEFILPYEMFRSAASPNAALKAFVDGTYNQAATAAGWDRQVLEHPVRHTPRR